MTELETLFQKESFVFEKIQADNEKCNLKSKGAFKMSTATKAMCFVAVLLALFVGYQLLHSDTPTLAGMEQATAAEDSIPTPLKTMSSSNSGLMAKKCHRYCGGESADQEVCAEAMVKGGEAVQAEQDAHSQALISHPLMDASPLTGFTKPAKPFVPSPVKKTLKKDVLIKLDRAGGQ